MNVSELIKRYESIDIASALKIAIEKTRYEYLELQREQLLEGKGKDGKNITPSYLDDPYFETQKQAQSYSDWKDRITPNEKRDPGTPNLFIDGSYVHDKLKIGVDDKKINIQMPSPIEAKVIQKYQNAFGLNRSKVSVYIKTLKPVFIKEIKNKLG